MKYAGHGLVNPISASSQTLNPPGWSSSNFAYAKQFLAGTAVLGVSEVLQGQGSITKEKFIVSDIQDTTDKSGLRKTGLLTLIHNQESFRKGGKTRKGEELSLRISNLILFWQLALP